MTIRLTCAQCRRKLKVPDAALGKKVQCPACGARFIGQLDSTPPALPETPAAVEQPAPIEEPVPTSAPVEPATVSFPNLQLEEPAPIEGIEPVDVEEPVVEEPVVEEPVVEEPAAVDVVEEVTEPAAESDGVEPIVVEEEPVMDVTTAAEETDAVDVVDQPAEALEPEIVDEEEAAEEAKPRPKKKKRGMLCGCLAAVGLVMLLGCGVGGFFGYRWWTGSINVEDWKPFSPPNGDCMVSMPGEPVSSTETPQPGVELHKFTVEKKWARSEFVLAFHDVPSNRIGPTSLDNLMNEEVVKLTSKLNATIETTSSVRVGQHEGKETRLRLPNGRKAIVRLYLARRGQQTRVYELAALGPDMDPQSGPGGRFFGTFFITSGPAAPPIPRPPGPPGPRPGP